MNGNIEEEIFELKEIFIDFLHIYCEIKGYNLKNYKPGYSYSLEKVKLDE